MDRIKVKVADLYKQLHLMKSDGMEYVTLYILEPDSEYGIPAVISLEAEKESDHFDVGYEDVESVE